MSSDVVVVLSTMPSASAEGIARALVEERLAACVNLVGPVRSVYRWDGAVQAEDEVLAVIKTTAARYEEMAARLKALHPYDVPEIVMLPVGAGFAPYLDWVQGETQAQRP